MKRSTLVRAVLSAAALVAAPILHGGSVDPELSAAIAGMKPGQEIAVVVTLADRVSLESFAPGGVGPRSASPQLVAALQSKAANTQRPVLASAAALGGHDAVSLWAINAVALKIPHEAVTGLAKRSDVESIQLDAVVQAPATLSGASAPAPEWNIQMMGAPDRWAAGATGSGIVVATLDTGVDAHHPDLGPRWRSGSNSWFDPNGQHTTPYDASGHGTQTLGLIVGGSSGGTSIGMAPGATWIAAKIFNDAGQATLSGIHQAFQWVLDPDGNPATIDSPHVVNNSWGLTSSVGACDSTFADDISVLRAAGIGVVFAAGNEGGAAGTSESPANNAGAFPTGAIDSARTVAPFSSRGPSACDNGIFPTVVAPGVSVRTSDLTFGGVVPNSYAVVSGTSFAAPHMTGAMALLWSAHPGATLAAVESALTSTAVDLGIPGPDNDTGYGIPNLSAADTALAGTPTPPVARADSYTVEAGTTINVIAPGVLTNDSSPSGGALTAALASTPAAGSLTFAADGSFSYVAPATGGTYSFIYTASDGKLTSAAATVTLTVTSPQPPVANGDAYTTTATATSPSLGVTTPGLLGNDTSPSGKPLTAVLVTGPTKLAGGSFTLNANGSFTYWTKNLTATTDMFTYRASDGTLQSAPATVTITITAHPAPVAGNDSFSVARNSTGVALNVLANDTATNATLASSSITVVRRPSHGTVTANANGTVTYKPARNYRGSDSFTYNVKDSLGATSNTATAQLTVQ